MMFSLIKFHKLDETITFLLYLLRYYYNKAFQEIHFYYFNLYQILILNYIKYIIINWRNSNLPALRMQL